jgi:hypothetical protein
MHAPTTSIALTSCRLDLWSRALCALLTLDSLCSALSGSSQLGLVSLLLLLSFFLLLFGVLDGSGSESSAGFRSLGSSFLDYVEGGTDNGTLLLYGATASLLGNFL